MPRTTACFTCNRGLNVEPFDDCEDDDNDDVICSRSWSDQNQPINQLLQPITAPLQVTWTNMAASLMMTEPGQSITDTLSLVCVIVLFVLLYFLVLLLYLGYCVCFSFTAFYCTCCPRDK